MKTSSQTCSGAICPGTLLFLPSLGDLQSPVAASSAMMLCMKTLSKNGATAVHYYKEHSVRRGIVRVAEYVIKAEMAVSSVCLPGYSCCFRLDSFWLVPVFSEVCPSD